jgi:hypothetical protein
MVNCFCSLWDGFAHCFLIPRSGFGSRLFLCLAWDEEACWRFLFFVLCVGEEACIATSIVDMMIWQKRLKTEKDF